jgi:glycosyltransferase involved in cell wall biosynthesis
MKLRRIIASRAPRVVHSHIAQANLLARVTRLLARMPVLVCTAHSIIEGGRLLELGYRYSDRLADLTTIVSQAAVERYVRIGAAPAHRLRFVPNGLDLARFAPDEAARLRARRELGIGGKFLWLAAGRFTEAKDYPTLVRAFTALADRDTTLLIAGRGPLKDEMQALANSLGLDDRVQCIGLRHDMPDLMNAADAYVMSSAWEGMPLVLQEASATGLPIVATDVGGNREVVVHDVSGLLVPANDPASLAQAMSRVMAMSDGHRRGMGLAGREFVSSQFGMEHVLDLWEGIYQELTPCES